MLLKERLESAGNWLFKWRSFLPLLTIGLFLIAMRTLSSAQSKNNQDLVWEGISFAISLFGLAIRFYIAGEIPKGTSGRTTNKPKARSLNTTGMYSVVRNPLYLGNFFVWFGFSMFPHSLFLVIILTFLFFIYYKLIILAEEKVLREKFGSAFDEWAQKTPALFPRFRNWRKASLPFSLKAAIKREYSTFFAIIAAFTCLEIGEDFFRVGKLVFDPVWTTIFFAGLFTYVILRALKKKGFLNVEGR
ncbi:MAG: isoprenylcysteine carboxylmethyltransferase family protein [Phycisphaerae bacterium]|nr:isoprenylcysteine carboxylmethyltransferase family protein [Phycisphaerae bacterium]